MEFISVEEARKQPGLRLVLAKGIWAAWSECAKNIFAYKKVPYAAVPQYTFEENAEIVAWTGARNQPQAVFDTEPVRTGWLDILNLAERLAPEPALLPQDPEARAAVIGLSNELCGEWGLGWCRRILLVTGHLPPGPGRTIMERQYGLARTRVEEADNRCTAIISMLGRRLQAQAKKGSRYFVGEGFTAADLYWACFSNLIKTLPPQICPMDESFRAQINASTPGIDAALDPILMEHRDHIYRTYLPPLDFA